MQHCKGSNWVHGLVRSCCGSLTASGVGKWHKMWHCWRHHCDRGDGCDCLGIHEWVHIAGLHSYLDKGCSPVE